MITVDEPEDTVLSNYTIPRSLGQYDNEIMEVYYGWESKGTSSRRMRYHKYRFNVDYLFSRLMIRHTK